VYGIGGVPANDKILKLNETLDIPIRVSDANSLGENKHIFCEGNEREALLVASNEVSFVANAEVENRKNSQHRRSTVLL
jgi:hypothetical protein